VWVAQKLKLASPSVTKWTLERPAGVSGTMPARTAAVHSCACCGPLHSFGCVNTNSILSKTESHLSSPPGSAALNSSLVELKRYPMKSAKTLTMVFPFGSRVFIWSFIAADSSMGEIISFHLVYCQHPAEVNASQTPTISSSGTCHHPGNPPRCQHHRSFRRDHNTMWRELSRTQGLKCLCTYPSFVTVCCRTRVRRRYLPCDRPNLRDFARIQQCISGATVHGPDVESDNQFS